MEMNSELALGKCDVVGHGMYLNQQKCEILKRLILHRIYNIPKEVVDSWRFFDYEFGINKKNEIESLVIFNGYSNELDYFYYSPIPIIILYGYYSGIEKFIRQITPLLEKDLEEAQQNRDNEV